MKFHAIQAPKVLIKENGYRPVEIPNVTHQSRAHWKNESIDIYNAKMGDSAYFNTLDLPMPLGDPSFIKRFGFNNSIRLIRSLLGLGAYINGRRGTHPFGVAGKGFLKIIDNPNLPDHEFYKKGREFKIRVRHSNDAFEDDAIAQVRGLAIKFADTNFESPLDLFFNTGPIHPFWNFDSLWTFMKARMKVDDQKGDWGSQEPWLDGSPVAHMGAAECMRNAPSSYADVVYHSLTVFPYTTIDGVQRYVKYRVMPKNLKKESGLLPYERQKKPWLQSRDEDFTGPLDYLRQEYHERIGKGPIEFTLQIQLRDFNLEIDTAEFFNLARYWDDEQYPWEDLAEFTIDEPISNEKMEPMRMFIGNSPKSLGILEAYSKYDYNSINWGRALVYNHSWRQRKRKNKYK